MLSISLLLLGAGCTTQIKKDNTNDKKQEPATQNQTVTKTEQKNEVQKQDTTKSEQTKPVTVQPVAKQPTPAQTTSPKPVVEPEAKATTKNCVGNLSCLVESSKTCEPAKVSVSYTVDFFGVNYSYDDYYEIKGTENGKCSFYMKTNNVVVKYGEEAKQALLEQGMTEAQILEYENKGTADAQNNFKDKDADCLFSQNSALTNLLTEWKADDRYTTSISQIATCTGSLINSTISGSGSTKINIGN